ncbi:hypothetical protein, partial [Escherichia coli]
MKEKSESTEKNLKDKVREREEIVNKEQAAKDDFIREPIKEPQ